MRKLFHSFFYVPKYGKVAEKVMMARMVTTVVTVVMCLAAMGIAAYAYFSCDIASDVNIIKSANFETTVQIQITDQNGAFAETIPAITSNYKSYKVNLEAGKVYTITVEPTQSNTAKTGFIIVKSKNSDTVYHTQQLGIDTNAAGGATPAITFQLMLTGADEVYFLAHWGTSAHYADYQEKGENDSLYITQGETVTLSVNVAVTESSEDATSTPQASEPGLQDPSIPTDETTGTPTDETTGMPTDEITETSATEASE